MSADFARGERVRVTFSGHWDAAPEQFFGDDGFPRRVTAADLAQAMRGYGDLPNTLREWDLEGCVYVCVEGEPVWHPAAAVPLAEEETP